MFARFLTITSALLFVTAVSLHAADSVGWRSDATGHYDVEKAPLQWSETENVVWRQEMPAWSNTSPVIVGDKVFTCAEPATLICVNKADGKVLWQAANHYVDMLSAEEAAQAKASMEKAAPLINDLENLNNQSRQIGRKLRKDRGNEELKKEMENLQEKKKDLEEQLAADPMATRFQAPKAHNANGYCSYIPVSNGTHVFTAFGLGTIACYKMDGSKVWAVIADKPTIRFGGSSSPVLVDDLVIIHFQDFVAYDAATGEERWRAKAGKESWGTPVVYNTSDGKIILTPQGQALKATDGSILADDLYTFLPYNAPVIHDGIAYVVGGNDEDCSAIKLPDSLNGEFSTLWKSKVAKNRYYASPLLHDGLLYVIHRSGEFTVLDAASGETVKSVKVDGMKGNGVYTSPTYAAGHIYTGDEDGLVVIFKAGKELEEVARINQEKTRCSPVFEDNKMYVRTNNHLMCVAAP